MRWNWELQHLLCDLGWVSLRTKSTVLRMAEQRDVRNLGLSWFCWITEITDPVYWPCYYARSQLLQCLSHFHLGLLLFGHSLGTSRKLLCIHKKNYRNDWIIAYTYYISNGVSNGFWNNIWRYVVFSILPQIKKIKRNFSITPSPHFSGCNNFVPKAKDFHGYWWCLVKEKSIDGSAFMDCVNTEKKFYHRGQLLMISK